MHFIKSLVLVSLAALTSAAALAGDHFGGPNNLKTRGQCLCQSDADKLTDAYVRIITKWNDADAKYLSDSGFADYSDSINILAGVPMGASIFPTKQAFIDHQHTSPDLLPINVTFKTFNCEYITLIWTVNFGVHVAPVRGITVLTAGKNSGKWQIKKIDVEFNSIAFLYDIGGTCAPLPAAPSK